MRAQFLRYVLVGGFAAGVDAGSLYALHVWAGVNPLAAAAVGFLLGLAVSYLLSIRWVFKSSGRFREEFFLFAAVGAGGLALTEAILWVAIDRAHLPVMAAKAGALALVLLWNFGMRKVFVFAGS